MRASGETHLWLLEARIKARLQITEITENTFFEFLHVPYWTSESLETKDESAHDISASDVIQAGPQHTRHIFARGKKKAVEGGVVLRAEGDVWGRPARRSGCEKEFEAVEVSH